MTLSCDKFCLRETENAKDNKNPSFLFDEIED